VELGDVEYAKSGDVSIAYQVVGDGPVDLAFAGLAVNIGARVTEAARPGEVLVSSTVKDLVAGSGIAFEGRGDRELKGAGPWHLYSVVDA